MVDGNNKEFIDIENQLDDGILSDGSEDLVQIYIESCKEGDIFWEGRDFTHVMQSPSLEITSGVSLTITMSG